MEMGMIRWEWELGMEGEQESHSRTPLAESRHSLAAVLKIDEPFRRYAP